MRRGELARRVAPVLQIAGDERRRTCVGELRRQHRRHRHREQVAAAARREPPQRADQRQVAVRGGLGQPVLAVRPAAVAEHPGQVGVEDEGEAPLGRLGGRGRVVEDPRVWLMVRPIAGCGARQRSWYGRLALGRRRRKMLRRCGRRRSDHRCRQDLRRLGVRRSAVGGGGNLAFRERRLGCGLRRRLLLRTQWAAVPRPEVDERRWRRPLRLRRLAGFPCGRATRRRHRLAHGAHAHLELGRRRPLVAAVLGEGGRQALPRRGADRGVAVQELGEEGLGVGHGGLRAGAAAAP